MKDSAEIMPTSDEESRAAERRSRWSEYLTRALFFVMWAGLLAGSFLALWEHEPLAPTLLLTLSIGLPSLLLFLLARIVLFRFSQRRFDLVDVGLDGHEAGTQDPAVRQAHALWEYERARTQTRYVSNLQQQCAVFGLLASAAVSGCVLSLSEVFGKIDQVGGVTRSAVASVLAAAVTSLLLAIGRLLVRIASNDATNRTFAYEARSFVLCLLCGVLFGCLTQAADGQVGMSSAVAIGVGIGILGDRAFLVASQRAAHMLGAEAQPATPALDLRLIEGLSSDDLSRLQEENITTVHALAFVPAPRLFFNSSLNFQRICDWQDQALLIEYFGETKAKVLREQVQVRGVTDALALAELREDGTRDEIWKKLVADLGFRGEGHVQFLLEKLRADGQVAVLRAYKRMALKIVPLDREAPARVEPRSA